MMDPDGFSESYVSELNKSISFISQEGDYFTRLKVGYIKRICNKLFDNSKKAKILDLGSGIGSTDEYLKVYLKNLFGLDISEKSLEIAKKRNPEVAYSLYNGRKIPFEDNTFDLCFTICVMHHVPPQNWNSFINEVKRIIKKGGYALIFEHNPLNPLTRFAVSRCEFDKDANLLTKKMVKQHFVNSGLDVVDEKFIILTPWGADLSNFLDNFLYFLPFGAQHYVLAQKS